MSKVRARKPGERSTPARRRYTREFKEEAVRMVLDGQQGDATAVCLEVRVRELEAELRRVKAEAHHSSFGTSGVITKL